MKKIVVAVLMFVAVNTYAEERTLSSVPKKFQARYFIIALSEDRGETMQNANNEYFCKISGNVIVNDKNETFRIAKVTQEEENGKMFTFLHLANGFVWVLSRVDSDPTWVLIQTYDPDTKEEVVRVLFEIR